MFALVCKYRIAEGGIGNHRRHQQRTSQFCIVVFGTGTVFERTLHVHNRLRDRIIYTTANTSRLHLDDGLRPAGRRIGKRNKNSRLILIVDNRIEIIREIRVERIHNQNRYSATGIQTVQRRNSYLPHFGTKTEERRTTAPTATKRSRVA